MDGRGPRHADDDRDPGNADLIDDPAYPLPQTVLVQLRNSDGTCWESRHSAPASKNTDTPFGQFKDKAD